MPSLLASKSSYNWVLNLAVLQASNDSREAPWYGPWNIVLQKMFQDFCPAPFYSATYPQFPLVKDIDVIDSDEEESDEELERDSDDQPEAGLYSLPLI